MWRTHIFPPTLMTWHEIAAQSPKKMTPLQSHLFPTVVSLLINGKKALCGFVWVEKGWEGALVPWAWLWVSAALVSWLRLQWTLLLRGARSLRWQWGPRGPRTLILNGETTHAQTLVITAFYFFFIFFFVFFCTKETRVEQFWWFWRSTFFMRSSSASRC